MSGSGKLSVRMPESAMEPPYPKPYAASRLGCKAVAKINLGARDWLELPQFIVESPGRVQAPQIPPEKSPPKACELLAAFIVGRWSTAGTVVGSRRHHGWGK